MGNKLVLQRRVVVLKFYFVDAHSGDFGYHYPSERIRHTDISLGQLKDGKIFLQLKNLNVRQSTVRHYQKLCQKQADHPLDVRLFCGTLLSGLSVAVVIPECPRASSEHPHEHISRRRHQANATPKKIEKQLFKIEDNFF